jgi:hypothetical protein
MKLTRENRSTRGKTCPSATLSTTNPTWIDPGSKPGLRGGRPAANRLNHGTAYRPVSLKSIFISPSHLRVCFQSLISLPAIHKYSQYYIEKCN